MNYKIKTKSYIQFANQLEPANYGSSSLYNGMLFRRTAENPMPGDIIDVELQETTGITKSLVIVKITFDVLEYDSCHNKLALVYQTGEVVEKFPEE